jgi:hypothetical protein
MPQLLWSSGRPPFISGTAPDATTIGTLATMAMGTVRTIAKVGTIVGIGGARATPMGGAGRLHPSSKG